MTVQRSTDRFRPGAVYLPVSVFIAFALAMAAAGLSAVIFSWSWYLPVLACLLATTAVTAGTRFFTASVWIPYAAGLLALGLALTAAFQSGTALLGFLPTPGSWKGFWGLLGEALNTVQHEVVPVNPGPGITYLTAATVGVFALVTDWIVLRARTPLASAGPLLAVLLVPAFLSYSSVGSWEFAGTALGFVMILAAARRSHRAVDAEERRRNSGQDQGFGAPRGGLGPAWVLSAAAVILTLLLPPFIPGFTDGVFPQGSRLGSLGRASGLNPLLSLNSNLRQTGNGTVISLFTDAPGAPYLRLTTIDSFSGDRWEPDNRDAFLLSPISQMISAGSGAPDGDHGSVQSVTEIHTGDFTSPYLLVPPGTADVFGVTGEWGYDPDNLAVKSRDTGTSAAQNFLADSSVPDWTADGLRALPQARIDVPDRFLALPRTVPPLVSQTAQQLTRNAVTPFDKALALQDYFHGAAFSYSITAPAEKGYDGTGMNVLEQFLKAKSGYCIHYATAMAVMARLAGIPSRVAVGFAPGHATGEVRQGQGGGNTMVGYSVAAKDAHAWPELYFQGAGWIRFEPTPSRGVIPGYAFGPTPADPGADVPVDPRPSVSTAPLPAGPTPTATPTPTTQAAARPVSAWEGIDWPELGWGLAAGVVVLLLAAAPRMLRSLQRRRRLSPQQTAAALSIGAMEELLATAADRGIRAGPAETPRSFGARLARPLGPDGHAAVQELVREYEQARYGSPTAEADPGPDAAAATAAGRIAAVGQELDAGAGPVTRARARWFPPSLFRRG
ncbi:MULTISPECIES: DUF3488 and transglutaminase-like domain-containing protein [Arthrobacter]|uniref:DUF3488 and transglutaminase-like domain-containing protein n=2 Tax=Arthrobacter TaxID=1663 RepID=A0ABU9KKC3_9MICC|nr:DUF3488 and transglutaminase-like domain-containing protein [Arthrobacter sp. YJM1]MDP5227350.1 DUF3488 and transglutaminase-like domain-containing protein [Arthrobacter sp. YJM1]